jgi:hypothetical protein
VPIVPFEWLQQLVKRKECDLSSAYAVKLRTWIQGIDTNIHMRPAQFMPYLTNSETSRNNVSPYISSPYIQSTGCSNNSKHDMLRVNNAMGTSEQAIALNFMKSSTIKDFCHASNIDNEVNNFIPAITTHRQKTCDFDALFNMAPVLNVKFFLGLIFTEVELRQLSQGLFIPASDDRPSMGALQRVEKQGPHHNDQNQQTESGSPWTAYGVHFVAILIIAAFLGEEPPKNCECMAFVASKITGLLMQEAPTSMMHPSGTKLLLRGFTSKHSKADTLVIPARKDRVQAAFFQRCVNDTNLMNQHPSMSILNSVLQPYMVEDMVHVQWSEFLRKCHPSLVQEWERGCVILGDEVELRSLKTSNALGDLCLSDMYRSLDPAKLPCNDTLLYGIYYPIIGVGLKHMSTYLETSKYSKVYGWVIMRDCVKSEIRIFMTDEEVHHESLDDDGEVIDSLRDKGCAAKLFKVATKDVFAHLRKMSMLVQPLIARPGVLLKHPHFGFGLLDFDTTTGQCYNPEDGMYTLRLAEEAAEASVDDPIDRTVKLTPVEVEAMMLGVPTNVLVDTQAFVIDGVAATFLPIGAARKTYIKCHLWYPHNEVAYIDDHVYLLAHKDGPNSTSFMTLSCHVSFLLPSEKGEAKLANGWEIIHSVRPMD